MTSTTTEIVQKLRELGPGGPTLRATPYQSYRWAHEIAADELERVEKHKDILARALLLSQQEKELLIEQCAKIADEHPLGSTIARAIRALALSSQSRGQL